MPKWWPWSSGERPSASWWIVLGSSALVIVFSFAIIREVIRSGQVRNQIDRLQNEIQSEAERHDQLEDLIAYLSSQTFQEREARLKLGLRKPGERVIVVPPGSVPGSTNTNTSSILSGSEPTNTSLPQRWWDYFFGERQSTTSQTSGGTVQ